MTELELGMTAMVKDSFEYVFREKVGPYSVAQNRTGGLRLRSVDEGIQSLEGVHYARRREGNGEPLLLQ
jgi:hypothetical protein